MTKKLRVRVIDIPATVDAAEVERQLNGICDDGYRLDRLVQTGIPEGVGLRVFFQLRAKSE